jgi:hypothetical protein
MFQLAPPKEVAVIGPLDRQDTIEMLRVLQEPYRPVQVVALATETETKDHPELVESRPAQDGQTTVYVCQGFTCKQPVTSTEALERVLAE